MTQTLIAEAENLEQILSEYIFHDYVLQRNEDTWVLKCTFINSYILGRISERMGRLYAYNIIPTHEADYPLRVFIYPVEQSPY